MVGNFIVKNGWMIAPGGAKHGTPMIATHDVEEMLVGGAPYAGEDNLLIEAGGPEWQTWRRISDIIAKKVGRKKISIIPLPRCLTQINKTLAAQFSAEAANMFALMGFIADYQPRWDSTSAVQKLNLPKQWTLMNYLDANYI